MIKQIVQPKDGTLVIDLPNDYIGKTLELLIFPFQSVKEKIKQRKSKKQYNLSSLAGKWSSKESAEFEKNTEIFNKIDDELWR